MSRRHPRDAGVTVVQSVRPSSGANQYIPLLLRSVPEELITVPFAWPAALFGRYDLFHLHWPEGLMRGGSKPADIVKKVLTGALIVRLHLTATPVIRTLHNTQPHEQPSAIERLQTRLLERRTVAWIRMTRHTPVPRTGRAFTIPHGHYRDWFPAPEPTASGGARSLLFFGHVRPYKGVEQLLRAFADLERPGTTLRVVGQVRDDALRCRIERLASPDDRVTLALLAVDDAALAREVGAADVVVLPYEDMHNSGAMLLALSLDRPVVVPRNAVTTSLADEVGAAWVATYDPPLDAVTLARALDEVDRSPRPVRPDLSHREWSTIGRQLAAAYVATLHEERAHA